MVYGKHGASGESFTSGVLSNQHPQGLVGIDELVEVGRLHSTERRLHHVSKQLRDPGIHH